ncbi:hypothetical protein ABFX02_12G129900 [Erythranthe guttata]
MLTCIARLKQSSDDSRSVDHHPPPEKPNDSNGGPSKQVVRTLSSQIKDVALKASGAYRHCAPCANHPVAQQPKNGSFSASRESDSDKFRWSYRRTGSSSSTSTAGRKELKARLKGISNGEETPVSASGRRVDPVVFVEESESKEWVAQVEPGVLITFVSLPRGCNDLKQIKFSREMFDKWLAQRWWADNSEKVMELYNVQRLNRQAVPLPSTPTRSENDDISSPVTPPLSHERQPPPRTDLHQPIGTETTTTTEYSSSDSCSVLSSTTPKLSSTLSSTTTTTTTTTKTETSSSTSGEMSVGNNNGSCSESSEWVEQDKPGVYITIRSLPDGRGRELVRVRFSREKFGEMHAKVWWEENRARIHKQYL